MKTTMLCLLLVLCSSAFAFRVIKNVNSGKPLEEKRVLFEKGKPHELTFSDNENCKITLNGDGAIESRMIGNGAINAVISWKEPFNAKDYQYLVLTARLEGKVKTTVSPGKVSETRPDNLWMGPALVNAKGERVGGVSMADLTEDQKTPAETVTMKIPMMLFTSSAADSTQITGVSFHWTATRPNVDRDFRLVIDRIALAN